MPLSRETIDRLSRFTCPTCGASGPHVDNEKPTIGLLLFACQACGDCHKASALLPYEWCIGSPTVADCTEAKRCLRDPSCG